MLLSQCNGYRSVLVLDGKRRKNSWEGWLTSDWLANANLALSENLPHLGFFWILAADFPNTLLHNEFASVIFVCV